MQSVTTTSSVAKTLPLTQTQSEEKSEKAVPSDFDSVLGNLLQPGSDGQVSEEELFAGLVQERLGTRVSAEVAEQFGTEFASQKAGLTKPDGYISFETAAKAALLALQGSGAVTSEQAGTVYSEAFSGAQLDANKEALFDDRGGPNDATIAMATLEAALLSARGIIEQFDDGTLTADPRDVGETPSTGTGAGTGTGTGTGTSSIPGNVGQGNPSDPSDIILDSIGNPTDGADGFLYKPVSESDGNLAVLLPAIIAGRVSELQLLDAEGNLLEVGRFAGNANGERDHFRFTKPGGEYPDGLKIIAKLPDGRTQSFNIADSSERYD